MKTLIISVSKHHGNTNKIVEAMKPILEAQTVNPDEFDIDSIDSFELIGFASGTYMGKPDKDLLGLIEKIPYKQGRKAFTVTTSGSGRNYNSNLNTPLTKKGFEIIGEFNSRGWATVFVLALFGGISKGRPHEEDLERARQFARDIKNR